jgi:hypothetical protein
MSWEKAMLAQRRDREVISMDKFIPKEKLSKKAKRELAKAQRQTWGGLSPVTRKPENPKAYIREKPRNESDDDTGVCSWQKTFFFLRASRLFSFRLAPRFVRSSATP